MGSRSIFDTFLHSSALVVVSSAEVEQGFLELQNSKKNENMKCISWQPIKKTWEPKMKLLLGLFFVAFCQGHFTRPPSLAKKGQNEVADNTCPSGCSCSFYESTQKLRTIECSMNTGN